LRQLYISAPFGNYYSHPDAISVLGTFTLLHRAGFIKKWWRVFKTLRPYPGGWINKLGLPNPGIEAAPRPTKNSVLSLYGFDCQDWHDLICKAYSMGWEDVELNLSCPNVNLSNITEAIWAAKYAKYYGMNVIAKLGPVKPMQFVVPLVLAGVTKFHLCNTIPTPNGGISGAALKPFSLWAVEEVRKHYPLAHIIGGGGINNEQDIKDYISAGANDVAIGGGLMNPFTARKKIAYLVEYLKND
jgi:dihydroorotate dehydrogenase